MGLPWVRLDANIASHDKVLRLVAERDGWRAAFVYVCSLGWAGGHGTDGHIPKAALPMIHGTEKHARMLVDHRLWDYTEGGWLIRNWAQRQELSETSEAKAAAAKRVALKANCVRWHGEDCGCWKRSESESGSESEWESTSDKAETVKRRSKQRANAQN